MYKEILNHTQVIPLDSTISEDSIQKHLLNRCFINSTFELLKEVCNETNKSNTKRFLLSYLIYHKHLFNDNPTDIETEIVELVGNMLNTLHQMNSDKLYISNLTLVNTYYSKYIDTYTRWATLDKKQINTSLIHAHSELSNTQKYFNDNQKEITTDDIKETQELLNGEITGKLEDIEHRLKIINGVKQAEDIKTALTANAETIHDDSILKIVRKAFWDIFTEEIEKNDYSRLYVILDEIKSRLKTLIPNRHDIHIELDQNIDVELYKQMITNGAFETADFMKLIEYLISQIKQYIAPVHDTEIDLWVVNLYENIGDVYSKTLPSFFEKYYNYLEITEKELEEFRRLSRNT